jgi:hypothetical protein
MPRIGSSFMPPVVPYESERDTTTMSGRVWHRRQTPAYDLYVQTPRIMPAVDEHLQQTARRFARHFGAVPHVAVLVFDAPADPTHEFDFTAFQQAHVQVLAFVRDRKTSRDGELGLDEALMRARMAEIFLAAYADSIVAGRTGRYDASSTTRAMDRLPHWFSDAVISRVARPEAVEPGLAYVRANRVALLPLHRLFAVARLGGPTWCEFADAKLPAVSVAAPRVGGPPPVLLSAESTVFGEFLVDRYGPTFLQAMAEALLDGVPTEQALASLPNVPDDRSGLEESWRDWLGRR